EGVPRSAQRGKKVDQADGSDHLRRAGGADRRPALRRGADAFHSLESAVRHYRRHGIGGLVVGIGGGSVLDVAKLLSVLLHPEAPS
ncbi:iron-containing alcohol dehydrogenase, partial [Klebsiella pneumoniae]|nr:iron-containing alcohol dehydrogenase [Klebsiella pneumoniae]